MLRKTERKLLQRASKTTNSPTATLFRNSRLVTVIEPLPKPNSVRVTAKDSYPRHQAIYSPPASRSRGDFGLKRNLPPRVKNQYIRFNELDTLEHRTTFESAHDHVLMVKKWQEMNIPLGKRRLYANFENTRNVSAFQADSEPTEESPEAAEEPIVWGSTKPVLSTLGLGELEGLINKEFLPKRSKFLKWCYAREWDREMQEKMDKDPKFEPPQRPKDAEIDIGALRADLPRLNRLIAEFFNLPSSTTQPYVTHPSAGLHYILNGSHMSNDPRHGPLRQKLVVGRNYNINSKSKLALIGGFAVHSGNPASQPDYQSRLAQPLRRITVSGFTSIDTQTFVVSQAHISPAGRIKLTAIPTSLKKNDPHIPRYMSSTEQLKEWDPRAQSSDQYAPQVNRLSQASVDLFRIGQAGSQRSGGEVQPLRPDYEPLIQNLTNLSRKSRTLP